MSGFKVEFDGLHLLQADLTEAGEIAGAEVRKSIQQAGMTVKKAWQDDARKSFGRLGRQVAPTIDYEENEFGSWGRDVFDVEVGVNLTRYGGKTGRGGLAPSLAALDEANGGIRGRARGTRKRAEAGASQILEEKIGLAVSETLRKAGL